MMPTPLSDTVITQRGEEFWAQSSTADCSGCALSPGSAECLDAPCVPSERADRSYVIWVKAE